MGSHILMLRSICSVWAYFGGDAGRASDAGLAGDVLVMQAGDACDADGHEAGDVSLFLLVIVW